MTADDDVDWTGCALAQNCVDVIQCHVVNHSVIDLHDLITTPKSRRVEEFRKKKHHNSILTSPIQYTQ